MNMKKNYFSYLFFLVLLTILSAGKAYACHGLALQGLSSTTNANDFTINGSSDPASCGCGPYYMEAEVVPFNSAFSGMPPVYTDPAWGTAPWFHSLLNVPGYGPPNWDDYCVVEPYTPLVIPFASLCSGTQYKVRVREFPSQGTPGPWSAQMTFTTPGTPGPATLNPTAMPSSICAYGSTWLDAFGGSCMGSGTFSWAPAAGLSNPNGSYTVATPSVTTTYTVTFYDPNLNQTFVDSVTVTTSSLVLSLGSMVEAGCGSNNGSLSVFASGGFSPYTYYWSMTGDTTSMISNISSSSYDVTVTDAIGCTQSIIFFLGDSCNPVWPGDANDDSLADNFDMLDIALANGATGTTRANASLTWIGQPSQDWGLILPSGTDYKFVDCNGDGIVDLNDTTAVLVNYGLYHTYRLHAPVYDASLPDLRLNIAADSVSSGGVLCTGQIELGTQSVQASNVYGIAFTINFDPAQIDVQQTGAAPVSSWMGTTPTNLFGADHADTNGHLAVVISRYDHWNNTGNGTIGTFSFRTSSALNGTGNSVLVPFTITDVRMIDVTGVISQVNPIGDTVKIYDGTTGLAANGAIDQFGVYPNPASGAFTVQFGSQPGNYTIEVIDAQGRTVHAENIRSGGGMIRHQITTGVEASGLYLVRVKGPEGLATQKIICR